MLRWARFAMLEVWARKDDKRPEQGTGPIPFGRRIVTSRRFCWCALRARSGGRRWALRGVICRGGVAASVISAPQKGPGGVRGQDPGGVLSLFLRGP